MNRRIKSIYILTILGILAFCGFEGYWLYQQYFNYLQETAADMYLDIVNIAEEAVDDQLKNAPEIRAISRIDNVSKGDTTCYSGYLAMLQEGVNTSEEWVQEIVDSIDNGLRPSRVTDIFRFQDVDVSNANTKEFQDAMTRSLAFKNQPLNVDSVAIAIEKATGKKCRVQLTDEEPNKLWKSKLKLPESVLKPEVTVTYPYNPIDGKGIMIVEDIPIGTTIRQMGLTLCVAIVVAIMLITCLVLQIKTIRRQQKIAEFQKGYTLTMLHELKRPIGALKLFISFMRNPRLNDADRREALDNGAKEVDNLASYFEKLRAITYSEAYEAPLSLTTFDLTEAAKECAANSQANVEVRNLDVSTRSWQLPVLVTAERQSIVNVLANLIENAVKYSPANSPIDIELSKTDTSVEISVADRGRGISDADKARIFDRFYRADDNRDLPGIGLGLAYVRQVVSAHGGEISVADRNGGGTIFNIKLPQ